MKKVILTVKERILYFQKKGKNKPFFSKIKTKKPLSKTIEKGLKRVLSIDFGTKQKAKIELLGDKKQSI